MEVFNEWNRSHNAFYRYFFLLVEKSTVWNVRSMHLTEYKKDGYHFTSMDYSSPSISVGFCVFQQNRWKAIDELKSNMHINDENKTLFSSSVFHPIIGSYTKQYHFIMNTSETKWLHFNHKHFFCCILRSLDLKNNLIHNWSDIALSSIFHLVWFNF